MTDEVTERILKATEENESLYPNYQMGEKYFPTRDLLGSDITEWRNKGKRGDHSWAELQEFIMHLSYFCVETGFDNRAYLELLKEVTDSLIAQLTHFYEYWEGEAHGKFPEQFLADK